MHRIFKIIFIMGLIFNFNQGAGGQENSNQMDRKPAAAGRFYPDDADELKTTLKNLFSRARPCASQNVVAIVSPHAGYIFSGIVAASGYNQVDPKKQYDNVFIIASSHQVSFPGASVYNRGDYITPLGKVRVNTSLANDLISGNSVFCFNPEADRTEHSIEVQVPFLQYHLKKDFKLVPIVIGEQSAATCQLIAAALKPWFNGHNLFVFSTDFSHYPSFSDALPADKATCNAIVSGSPDELLKLLQTYKDRKIPNLSTNLCGWTAILTMLYLTSGDTGFNIRPVQYLNSGDSEYGDKKQVVGYWSLCVSKQAEKDETPGLTSDGARDSSDPGSQPFNFSMEDKIAMLNIARSTIARYVRERRMPEAYTYSPNLEVLAGVFVTLKEGGRLRGCIGRFTSTLPLYSLIAEMAVAASTEDSRFEPVKAAEISSLEIEISVLSPLKKINSPNEIMIGKHGIYVKKGYHSGTFLPQVATEAGWNREEFLGHCSRDKAGIGWDGWKGAELFTYEACVFSENELNVRKD